jgi:hypothetical protein
MSLEKNLAVRMTMCDASPSYFGGNTDSASARQQGILIETSMTI